MESAVDTLGLIIKKIYRFFRKLKFRYKLSLYFIFFGIFIGYVSFALYTRLALKQITGIMSGVVEGWVEGDSSGNDPILNYIDRPYVVGDVKSFPVLRYMINDLVKNPAVKSIVIYYYNRPEGKWFLLLKDNHGYIRSSSDIPAGKIPELESALGSRISYDNPVFPGKKRLLYFRVNITKPGDINSYIVEVEAYRAGFLNLTGIGVNIIPIYALCIFLLSLLISRIIALHISRPIQKLSYQASQIAGGNLEIRTEIISRDEIGNLSSAINTMADEIRDYVSDINQRMDAMSVMNQIDKAVLSSSSSIDLVERVTSFVSELFSNCYIALGIEDRGENVYHLLTGSSGSRKGHLPFSSITVDLLEKNRSFYIFDPETDSRDMELISRITGIRFSHFVNIPIYIDEEYIGSFVAGKTGSEKFTGFEVDSLMALADQVGVAMKSVRSVEEKEGLYLGIITSLSKAIDAKSRWTAGHSERVAAYSVRIASRLGLEMDLARDIYMSAILHDIGKIGVPEHLLDKPGKLTPDEYRIVQEHSYQGALIVSEIPGSGNVKSGVLSHHESWDGGGYPFGLEGERIPLIARIITVADVYDSIVSDRPYRKGMKVEDAVDFLIMQKERLFDPLLVDIMVELIISGGLNDPVEKYI